ncbi:patatin-like phospholipase family protein [Nonomuraea sp. NPDC050404]|uniref:patatin-like phospholipase family protein n=1 Tax=Nonomuraea sp. NPDC050404 TaxID=3155783 RepID=UPI0034094460
MTQESAPVTDAHAVLRVIADRVGQGSRPGERRDGFRVALAIEGGGMRGTVSAGMALGLHDAGMAPAFDAVYGASAGAITGAWLLSGTPEHLNGWAEPAYAKAMIRLSNLWRRQPMVDVRNLVEHLYAEVLGMDCAAILANPIEYHPLATDAHTGTSTDLRPYLSGPAELRLALRASAALPFLAGPPVELGGRLFYDAGLAESVPYRTALAQGATHVLVLRSRPQPWPPAVTAAAGMTARPSYGARLIAATALRGYPEALRHSYFGRDSRLLEDDELLARYDRTGLAASLLAGAAEARSGPAVLSVRPAPDSPQVGRLTRDGRTLKAAMRAGRAAIDSVLAAVAQGA